MDVRQAFHMAVRNLFVNKARFLHATLAMVVGVAGVVVVLMISSAMLNLNTGLFDAYAPASFNTYVSLNANYPKAVTLADMEQVARDNPDIIKSISPLVWSPGVTLNLRNDDKLYETGFYGVGESYLELYPHVYMQEGRFLQYMDIEREQKVCVIGCDIANELFNGDALGKTVKIWGENFTIVGVIAESQFGSGLLDCVLIPYSIVSKILGEDIRSYNEEMSFYYDQYQVVANGVENVAKTKELLQDMLREKTGGETGTVYEPGTKWALSMYSYGMIGELAKGAMYQFWYLCLLAAAFVLLLGCVGIMNVMLASVQERTKEIGIRKAFGATNKDIKRQFTMESIITSLIGGVIGIVVGLAVVLLMDLGGAVITVNGGYPCPVRLEDMTWLTLGVSVAVPMLICVGAGVIAAAYPAQQAVKMEIVDAINTD